MQHIGDGGGGEAVVSKVEYSEEEICGPRGFFFCPERIPVNRLISWLMINITGRRGRTFVDKLSIAKPAESTQQVFQSSDFP